MIDTAAWSDIFVLLEDARPGGNGARVFARPRAIVSARRHEDVAAALVQVRAATADGLFAAGWLSYEAAPAFEPRLAAHAKQLADGPPLLWFGLFDAPTHVQADALARTLPDADGAFISHPRPRMTYADYESAFARVRAYLEAGDVYQVNLSYRADFEIHGDPMAAYARLRRSGQGGWSAAIYDGAAWVLSTSPELFFTLTDGRIEAKPMKGTAQRGADAAADRQAIEMLLADPKQRAENIMIVDLLRNDISKIAQPGSVHVPALLSVETYPTLHTLTSTVHARVKPGCDAFDALRALFPCGSITGAPKVRAMEVINELEADARGIYTGAIGWIAPDGSAEFSVAIRTIALADGKAELGLGSAVVIDSACADEWEECATKARFVTANAPNFTLLETMAFTPEAGIALLDLHLARLAGSARALSFRFDEEDVRQALHAIEALGPRTVRLSLREDGVITLDVGDARVFPALGVDVVLAPRPMARADFRLAHKTSLRAPYDDARRRAGADEVIFFDEEGFLTEGSFTNVFASRGDQLLTPPLTRGLLPGVLRAALLQSGRAIEADLRAEDLSGGFLIGNAARGLTCARLTAPALGAQLKHAP